MLRFMSPISSRKRVPPSASSKRPLRLVIAPVNAPFSCPNSSLSSRSRGMAPQFTGTKGWSRRAESSWMLRATSSLPVPDSPRTRTLVSCRRPVDQLVEPMIATERPTGKSAKPLVAIIHCTSRPLAASHCSVMVSPPASQSSDSGWPSTSTRLCYQRSEKYVQWLAILDARANFML